MRFLHLIASVDAQDGGPIEYARIVAEQHKTMGHESVFATLDGPLAPCVGTFAFPVLATGPGIGKFRFSARYGATIADVAPSCDAAIIHGLWNFASIGGYKALRDADLPYVVFSHGMLDPWFRKEKPLKHLLKQLFWTLWQGRVLSGARAVLFTCEEERRLARGAFWGYSNYIERVVAFCAAKQVAEEPDGMSLFLEKLPALAGRRYFLFLSRIHPKKACDQLIEAFSRVAGDVPDIDLVIAGPDQEGWQRALMEQAARLGVSMRIHWPGMLKGAAKVAAYSNAEAFILPSHQENFGLVVAEALSCGTPVLISNKVNIWREVEIAHAGLVAPDTSDATESLLRNFIALEPQARKDISKAAKDLYDEKFSVQRAAEDLLNVLCS
tara:strand:- start:774 stop:1922 length:1149 start_codon:yes stop_codon:yes gene_type:complete